MTQVVPQNARCEIKFVTYRANLDNVISWLKLNHAGFIKLYTKRWINNIYFDSDGFDCFQANISGVSSRAKVRYRWYGDLLKTKKGSLEIKRKRNFFGWKHHFNISEGPDINQHNWIEIKKILSSQIPIEGKAWLRSHPVPVFINRYIREYFISNDGKVRVTIDNEEKLWGQIYGVKPNTNKAETLPEMIVIEFKFYREHQAIANSYIQELPLRVSRHSKYVNGVNTISGNGVWY